MTYRHTETVTWAEVERNAHSWLAEYCDGVSSDIVQFFDYTEAVRRLEQSGMGYQNNGRWFAVLDEVAR